MTTETSNARAEWVLVPRVPTEAMLDAMHSRIRILCDPAERTASIQNDREVWAAMLAGSPPAPVPVPLDRLTALDGLVDRIAEAIRDGAGLAEGDPPWERLGEERRAPWRADAKRALSVVKESLTAAGILAASTSQPPNAEVWALPAKWRDRAANNPGSFAAAANVVCADDLEAALAADGVQAGEVAADAAQRGCDLRNLILMDAEFSMRGSTSLDLPSIQRLEARGWVLEGHENCEYDITDEGRKAIVAALSQQPDPKPEARGVVDEAMVERAWVAFCESAGSARQGIRAALTAALAAQHQEPTT